MRSTTVHAAITPVDAPRLSAAAWQPQGDMGPAFYFTAPLVHEGANDNRDVFSRAEMQAAWPTLIGMPLDRDHDLNVDGIVGVLVDAAYTEAGGTPTIRVTGAVWSDLYPEVVRKIRCGVLTGISMECLFASARQTAQGRLLQGVRFIGAGLTRMPADPRAHIDQVGDGLLPAAARRRSIIIAATAAALQGVAA